MIATIIEMNYIAGNIIGQDNCVGILEIYISDCSESFLSCCVPLVLFILSTIYNLMFFLLTDMVLNF